MCSHLKLSTWDHPLVSSDVSKTPEIAISPNAWPISRSVKKMTENLALQHAMTQDTNTLDSNGMVSASAITITVSTEQETIAIASEAARTSPIGAIASTT
jgi:hypothetical protein